MNGRQTTLSIVAALLFVGGLMAMMLITPTVRNSSVPTTGPGTLAGELLPEETTEPPTEPPATLPPDTQLAEDAEAQLSAKYAFVYSTEENRLLYLRGNQDEALSPASLTKLLTAKVALSCLKPDAEITVGEEITWIDPESSVAYLQVGHRLSVEMLIQGLLMQSGNDAAYTLAVAGGRALSGDEALDRRQAIDVFLAEMNRQAGELGMESTHFENPDGIDAETHYTTVRDLVTLTLAVLDQPLITKYCSMEQADVTFASGEVCTWFNSNSLLDPQSEYYRQEAMGLKTGSTSGAGKCLISLFQEGEHFLIIGVLGSTDDTTRYTDTLLLYQSYT